eukprot:TRINITY_DN10514_c0_g1_i5.p1 TRINITY_DN10514_c0_g1~~TRINITY_DN10514_c0_g1_i5.p1  ORF type:complete len:244 (+),score=16.68 TRINITY_DN10514_c0_g1_i5:346-1077(+)
MATLGRTGLLLTVLLLPSVYTVEPWISSLENGTLLLNAPVNASVQARFWNGTEYSSVDLKAQTEDYKQMKSTVDLLTAEFAILKRRFEELNATLFAPSQPRMSFASLNRTGSTMFYQDPNGEVYSLNLTSIPSTTIRAGNITHGMVYVPKTSTAGAVELYLSLRGTVSINCWYSHYDDDQIHNVDILLATETIHNTSPAKHFAVGTAVAIVRLVQRPTCSQRECQPDLLPVHAEYGINCVSPI